jgi:carbon monoxide dehydrogenase subunit G
LGKIEEFGGVGDEVLAVVKAKIGFVDGKVGAESKPEAVVKEGEGVDEKSGDGNGTATPAAAAAAEESKSNDTDAKQ